MALSRKIAIASCCLLIGSASVNIDKVSSFTAPVSIAQRTRCRNDGTTTTKLTFLGVRTQSRSSSTESNEDVSDTTGRNPMNFIDELWSKQNMPMDGDELQLTNGSSNNGDIMLEEDSSADSTKWILVGGTAMIIAAAGALAVTMGNDLGIDLELG